MSLAQRTLLAAALAVAACSPVPQATETENQADEPVAKPPAETQAGFSWAELLPNGAEPFPGVFTAGQPSRSDFEALSKQSLGTVINLRYPTERGTRDEPQWIEELGLDYVAIPVRGAEGLTRANARALHDALETSEGPILLHCGSSNRVGGLLALRAFHFQEKSVDDALEIGRAAGLTRLEEQVREILERSPR